MGGDGDGVVVVMTVDTAVIVKFWVRMLVLFCVTVLVMFWVKTFVRFPVAVYVIVSVHRDGHAVGAEVDVTVKLDRQAEADAVIVMRYGH